MMLRFSYVFVCINNFCLFYCWVVLHVQIYHNLFSHLLMVIWVISSFKLLQIELLWTLRYKALCGHMFSFLLGKIPMCRMRGSYGKYMFNIPRNYQSILQNGFSILYFHHQCMKIPVAPHLGHSISVWWYLIVGLFCSSLITNDVEHIFMCLMAMFKSFV